LTLGFLDWFRKERSLADVSLEEVKGEELRLGIREKQVISKIENLDAQKKDIFGQGAKEKSPWRRRQMARRFQIAGFELKMANSDFARLSKELLTLQAIRHAVERREQDAEGKLSVMNLLKDTELVKLLEDDKITSEVYLQKLNDTLSVAEGTQVDLAQEVGKEGSELLDIWSRMDEGEIPDVEEGMKHAEKAVTKRFEKELE